MGPGLWNLGPVTWHLGLATWDLGPGPGAWDLGPGTWGQHVECARATAMSKVAAAFLTHNKVFPGVKG